MAIGDWIADWRLDWRLAIGLAIGDRIGDWRSDWRLAIGLAIGDRIGDWRLRARHGIESHKDGFATHVLPDLVMEPRCLLTSLAVVVLLIAAAPAAAQQSEPAQNAEQHHHHESTPANSVDLFPMRDALGTSWLPDTTPMFGIERPWHGWDVMLNGMAATQFFYEPGEVHRTGGFSTHQFSSTNWGMFIARRRAGQARVGLRAMLSLEPWTVPGRRRPR